MSIGLIVGYLSYSGMDDPTLTITALEPQIKDDLEGFRTFEIDFSILDDENYRSLEIYGENPVIPDVVGEVDNPFSPKNIGD